MEEYYTSMIVQYPKDTRLQLEYELFQLEGQPGNWNSKKELIKMLGLKSQHIVYDKFKYSVFSDRRGVFFQTLNLEFSMLFSDVVKATWRANYLTKIIVMNIPATAHYNDFDFTLLRNVEVLELDVQKLSHPATIGLISTFGVNCSTLVLRGAKPETLESAKALFPNKVIK